MQTGRNKNANKLTETSEADDKLNIAQLSETASFKVEDIAGQNDKKKITFYYADPEKKQDHLMLVTFPTDSPNPTETPMKYNKIEKSWVHHIEASNNIGEKFLINIAEIPGKAENPKAKVLQEGYISLKDGVLQPVNKVLNKKSENASEVRELDTYVLTKKGDIREPESKDECTLRDGERFIKVYTPPGYDPHRKQAYDFQITLDGLQYLEIIQMKIIFDNLALHNKISPPVTVFIPPYSGPPDEKKYDGCPPCVPKGYSFAERLKEYCCNPAFADLLASIPTTLHEKFKFNITKDPKHRTIWGVSAGALQASYTGLLRPDVFGKIVAQSPMAWNIPIQHITSATKSLENGEHWRQQITNQKKANGEDASWKTCTALLPEKEGDHKEYLTQIVNIGYDEITGKKVDPSSLTFYFDAGEEEKNYDAENGSANLVRATELFAMALKKKHANVHGVHIIAGGHHNMTWMRDIADIAKTLYTHIFYTNEYSASKELKHEENSTAKTAKLLNVSPEAFEPVSTPTEDAPKTDIPQSSQSTTHEITKTENRDPDANNKVKPN